MSTTTTIERLPADWCNEENFGDGWGDDDPCEAWRWAFRDYIGENYPHCSLAGNEIIGPATYRFDGLDMQQSTPPASDLKPLPEGGIYNEFCELHRDDWSDVIDQYIQEKAEARAWYRRLPGYCTQNDGDCGTCGLSSYGWDCRGNPLR